ncbi:MAG: aminotransferase class III-fold pyridoxal phosphate-dependent enzyme [Gammaproteobacteria bacterium]|nr:aminotransferase class III-fold pyridoxal phosphate-dependent enzyme [Gammaproteobacteria bacterium]MCY4278278.1 aminotransferase class III-fold pyridoxal phosphate-dependent enzyme [Gammaproteobacteria bacterium]MCY4324327.1 aminotransferase class III-fold pyridoxal phosphate-dependent enzyme [Gammaproteobacteria bacterium]
MDREDIVYPFASQARVVEIVKAEGSWLFTRTGQKILDAGGGAVVCNVGHARDDVLGAYIEAQREGYVLPPWRSPVRTELCERLIRDWLPDGMTRIQFVCSGSEAIETAAKIALQYNVARGEKGRHQIIVRTPSYHGTTLATAALSGHPARRAGIEAALREYPRVNAPYALRAPASVPADALCDFYLDQLSACIEAIGSEHIAAFVAEPIVGSSGGMIVPPDGYWSGIRAMCDAHGILLIADEVMTGFARTGAKFALDHWQVRPDILVAGKGLTGGHAPINGVFARSEIGEAIESAGMDVMFHTYSALSGPCGAASKVLEILARESLIERSKALGAKLIKDLRESLSDVPHVAEVRGKGLLIGIEVVRDRETLARYEREDAMSAKILTEAMRRDLFFYPGGTGEVRDILCLGPPLNTAASDLNRIPEIMRDSILAATSPH